MVFDHPGKGGGEDILGGSGVEAGVFDQPTVGRTRRQKRRDSQQRDQIGEARAKDVKAGHGVIYPPRLGNRGRHGANRLTIARPPKRL